MAGINSVWSEWQPGLLRVSLVQPSLLLIADVHVAQLTFSSFSCHAEISKYYSYYLQSLFDGKYTHIVSFNKDSFVEL